MRIDDSKVPPPVLAKDEAKARPAQAAPPAPAAPAPAVIVAISARAVAGSKATDTDPVAKRFADRVAALRGQIHANSYDVDLELLARRILREEGGKPSSH